MFIWRGHLMDKSQKIYAEARKLFQTVYSAQDIDLN